MRRGKRGLAEIEELIVAANVRAEKACRDHDVAEEWAAECVWWDLIVERVQLIAQQREASE